MSRAYERLVVLLGESDACLRRLHHVKKKLDAPASRPGILSDPSYAKLLKALVTAFPNEPEDLEKVPGYDLLQQGAKQVCDTLSVFYDTFLHALEFRDICLTTLSDTIHKVYKFSFEQNATIFVAFMDLLSAYVRVHLLLGMIADRKQIVSVYALAYMTQRGSAEQSLSKLKIFIKDTSEPLKQLVKDVQEFATRVVETLVSFSKPILEIMETPNMQDSGALSLFHAPDSMGLPVVPEIVPYLRHFHQLEEWIMFTFLICPQELYVKGAIELLRAVLGSTFVLPVCLDEYVLIHNEFEAVMAHIKATAVVKQPVLKKAITDATLAAVQGAGVQHKRRALWLFQDLSTAVSLCRDSPGLLAPKFEVIIAALSMARKEVLWYFQHYRRAPPKRTKYVDADYENWDIMLLVRAMNDMHDLIKRNYQLIQLYYTEFVESVHALRIKPLIDEAKRTNKLDATTLELLDSLLPELSVVSLSMVESRSMASLEPFRLSWSRCLSTFSTTTASTPPLVAMSTLIERVNEVARHTLFVDRISETVSEAVDLSCLFFFPEAVREHYGQCLYALDERITASMAPVLLLRDYPRNAPQCLPGQLGSVGDEVTSLGERMLLSMSTRVIELIAAVHGDGGLGSLREQSYHHHAARPDSARNTEPPPRPTESRESLRSLHARVYALRSLLALINGTPEIVAFRTLLSPREALRDVLTMSLPRILSSFGDLHGDTISRPSRVLEDIIALEDVMHIIEENMDFDATTMLKDALLRATHGLSGVAFELTTLEASPTDSLARKLIRWYTHFIEKRVREPGIMFSPNRKAFVSLKFLQATTTMRGSEFRAEDYADIIDLRALCMVLGGLGIRFMHQKLVGLVHDHAKQLLSIVASNSALLTGIAESTHDEARTMEALKRFKDLDRLASEAISIGVLLALRALLVEAQAMSALETSPALLSLAKTASAQLPPAGVTSQLQDLEQLVFDCGVERAGIDPILRAAMQNLFREDALGDAWNLLPVAFATIFASDLWRVADYRVAHEGHVNNAHCIGFALETLCTVHAALSAGDCIGDAQVAGKNGLCVTVHRKLNSQMRCYLNTASILVLRQVRSPSQQLATNNMLVFLDRFAQSSRGISMTDLQHFLPYSLMRTAYLTLFNAQKLEAHSRRRSSRNPPPSQAEAQEPPAPLAEEA